MLLAVIHANGTYQAHKQEHDPVATEDDLWTPDDYHTRLARAVINHLDKDMPVIYVPYWNNAWDTNVFTDTNLREKALETDPFLHKLGENVGRLAIHPQAAGRWPYNKEDRNTEILRQQALINLANKAEKACFVGAYTRACVADVAAWTINQCSGVEVFIDPELSVDIRGEAYLPSNLPYDIPMMS